MHKDRILYLNKCIDEESVQPIIEKIININIEDDEKDEKEKNYERKPISLIINSYGGTIYDGFALISVVERSKTPIHTYVYGKAMSMGLIIAVCGHKRYASKLATFMYHGGLGGVWGNFEYIKNYSNEYERIQKISDSLLLSKTKIKPDKLKDIRKRQKDWFISAEEALKLGIIDEII